MLIAEIIFLHGDFCKAKEQPQFQYRALGSNSIREFGFPYCGKLSAKDPEKFALGENYSPPEGFNPKDLHRLLEKVGSPSGADDLGNLIVLFRVYRQHPQGINFLSYL